MLKNKLYSIQSLQPDEMANILHARIRLNKDHPVFEGHFPGNPILPGICTAQIVLELMQDYTGKRLMMSSASQIKYLSFISPLATPEIQFELSVKVVDDNHYSCNVTVTAKENPLSSMKSVFKIIQE